MAQTPGSSTLQMGRILIVDDEIELTTALSSMLREQGYEAVGFTSSRKALIALKKEDFDILLTDLMMPEMDGMALLQAGLQIDPDLVAILMTGHGTVQTAVEAMRIGAFDYVLKPFKLREVLPILFRAMGVRRLRKENLQLHEITAMYELSMAMAFTLDSNTVLSKVADAALLQSEADEVSIMLPTPECNELYVAVVRGERPRPILAERIPIKEGIADLVMRQHQPLALENTINDPHFALFNSHANIRSAISMPMLAGGKFVGMLNVNTTRRYRPFRLGQVKALSVLAGIAASALESARLYQELQQAALQLEATVEERTRELQATNARLQKATRQAEEASRHKSQFLANMSHELRTPLNAILGFSELLQDPAFGPLIEKQGRYVGHIHSSGKHLLTLINDLLDLSKVEAGRLELRPEPFTLADALTAALEPFRVQVDAKGVALALQVDQAPASLVADPIRFKQILYNLISNAVKFTPTGGAITVMARPSDIPEQVEIAVQDTGIGIKAEDLSRLFHEFTQLDSTLAKPQQGTGLGLALTKRLVALHGGAVTVTSPGEGQGSTFTVTLPVRPPQTRGQVLLVEDDATLQAQIDATLQHAGFSVEATGDGEAALAQAARVPPDLVILDLALAGLPGLELLRRLRAEGSRCLPIIVLARGEGDSVQEALALGADEFLAKPVSLGVLTNAVERLLRQRGEEGVAAPVRTSTEEHEAGQ